jgi:hypothetical protein
MLLGAYSDSLAAQRAPLSDGHVRIGLGIAGGFVFPSIGLDVEWSDGQSGAVELNSDNDLHYNAFAASAANGVDELYLVSLLFADGVGIAALGSESDLLGRVPDLVGYEVESIRLVVHDVRVEPLGDGYDAEARFTFEFYGFVVPEPTSVALLVAGAGLGLNRGWARGYGRKSSTSVAGR